MGFFFAKDGRNFGLSSTRKKVSSLAKLSDYIQTNVAVFSTAPKNSTWKLWRLPFTALLNPRKS